MREIKYLTEKCIRNDRSAQEKIYRLYADKMYNVALIYTKDNDDGPGPSIVIEGSYTNSDNVTFPLRFEFDSGEVFEANAAIVEIPEGTDIIGKIVFDAYAWFKTISATQLDNAKTTDGIIIISETSNSAIFDEVADNLDYTTQAIFE